MWNDKPDGYPIPARNPTGMGTGMNFYPWVWVRVQISTHSLFAGGWVIVVPDPNPTRCHPYLLQGNRPTSSVFVLKKKNNVTMG
jgi:hypothetical protein